jgi:hypothetical protein
MATRKVVPTKPERKRTAAPTGKRRTQVQIKEDEGFFCDMTYLRTDVLKHRWDMLQNTTFKTGYVNVKVSDAIKLTPEVIAQVENAAACWDMIIKLVPGQGFRHFHMTGQPLASRHDLYPYIKDPEPGSLNPDPQTPELFMQGGTKRKVMSNGLYTRIDALLQQVLDETDAILGGMDDRPRRPSIAREINRRIGNAGLDVMLRCATCTKDLEENP